MLERRIFVDKQTQRDRQTEGLTIFLWCGDESSGSCATELVS
jgi:hypothetical protein